MTNAFIVDTNGGISGSLTQLVDGTSYLIAGQGINVTSQSNGSLKISQNNDSAFLGDNDTFISSSMGSNFTFSSSSANRQLFLTVSTSSLIDDSVISLSIQDIQHRCSIINQGINSGSIFDCVGLTGKCDIDVKFDGSDWQLEHVKQRSTSSFEVWPRNCDIDLYANNDTSLTDISASTILRAGSLRPQNPALQWFDGSSHAPTLETGVWGTSTSSLLISGTYLQSSASVCSKLNGAYTTFIVAQLLNTSSSPARDEAILVLGNVQNSAPIVYFLLETNGASTYFVIYRRDDNSFSHIATGGTPDTNKHIFELVQDGVTSKLYIDGSQILSHNTGDIVSLTLNTCLLGADLGGVTLANMRFARMLCFTRVLSSNERQDVRNKLKQMYGTP